MRRKRKNGGTPLSRIEDKRYGTVVDKVDIHHGAKNAGVHVRDPFT